jgi:hypothetical protein
LQSNTVSDPILKQRIVGADKLSAASRGFARRLSPGPTSCRLQVHLVAIAKAAAIVKPRWTSAAVKRAA